MRKRISASEQKVTVLSDRNKLLEEVAERKHLLERENLSQQLQVSRNQLKERDIQFKVSAPIHLENIFIVLLSLVCLLKLLLLLLLLLVYLPLLLVMSVLCVCVCMLCGCVYAVVVYVCVLCYVCVCYVVGVCVLCVCSCCKHNFIFIGAATWFTFEG